jgi:hypothetical protein
LGLAGHISHVSIMTSLTRYMAAPQPEGANVFAEATEGTDRAGAVTLVADHPVKITAKCPNPALSGALDVVTLRALWRAISHLRAGQEGTDEEFQRALAKIINQNGALAKALMDAKREF